MSLSTLLPNLDDVRQTGHGKYAVRCPAHNDRSPSLTIKEYADQLLSRWADLLTDEHIGSYGQAAGCIF